MIHVIAFFIALALFTVWGVGLVFDSTKSKRAKKRARQFKMTQQKISRIVEGDHRG